MSSQLEGIQTKKERIRKQCEKCHYGDKKRRLLRCIREKPIIMPGEIKKASQKK